jgi:hypothetical protein
MMSSPPFGFLTSTRLRSIPMIAPDKCLAKSSRTLRSFSPKSWKAAAIISRRNFRKRPSAIAWRQPSRSVEGGGSPAEMAMELSSVMVALIKRSDFGKSGSEYSAQLKVVFERIANLLVETASSGGSCANHVPCRKLYRSAADCTGDRYRPDTKRFFAVLDGNAWESAATHEKAHRRRANPLTLFRNLGCGEAQHPPCGMGLKTRTAPLPSAIAALRTSFAHLTSVGRL